MSITHSRPSTTVVLFKGEDLDPLAEKRAKFQRASVEAITTGQPLRAGDETPSTPAQEAAQDYDKFLEAALERATHVKMAALARTPYRELLAAHPPREDRRAPDSTDSEGAVVKGDVIETFTQDRQLGFNADSIAEPLIVGCLKAWDEDARPEGEGRQFDNDRALQAFVDNLSDGHFSRLFSAAVQLNQTVGPDPKARLSSVLAQMSSETSELQSDSEE
jgi:hypothetical protein